MRIIDADACSALFDEKYKATRQLISEGETHLDNLAEGFKEANDVIFSMPTIYPESLRPQGEWYLNEDGKWACSYCDGLAIDDRNEPEKWQAITNYCPNCGARMKGG